MMRYIILAILAVAVVRPGAAQYALERPFEMHDVVLYARADTAMADSLHIFTPSRTVKILRVELYTEVPFEWSDSVRVGVSGRSTVPYELGAVACNELAINSLTTLYTGDYSLRIATDAEDPVSVYAYFSPVIGTGTGRIRIHIIYIELL